MAEGEFALIRDHIEQALEAPTDPARWGSAATEADLYACLADAAVEAMDPLALERYAPLALAAARHIEHRLYLAVAARAEGARLYATGRPAESLDAFTRALTSFDDLGTRWQSGRTLVLRAGSLAALGRQDDARADRRRAIDLFTAIGADPAAQMARRGET